MKVTQHDFDAYQGDTFRQTLLVSANFPLAGKTGKMQVRTKAGGPVLLTFTTADATMTIGSLVTRQEPGGVERQCREVQLFQSATTMQAVPAGLHQYDLQFSDANDTNTLLRGRFRVEDQFSQ